MIYPDRVVKGYQETGVEHVHVFSPESLGAVAVPYTSAGIKTQPVFVAGLVVLTVYYTITGAGQTTLRAIPMSETDEAELPLSLTLGSGIVSGSGYVNIAVTLVCVSLKLQVLSTSNNVITARIFGRTV